MVMMLIYDFDSLRNKIIGAMTKSTTKFQETTEKFFSSTYTTMLLIISFIWRT